MDREERKKSEEKGRRMTGGKVEGLEGQAEKGWKVFAKATSRYL